MRRSALAAVMVCAGLLLVAWISQPIAPSPKSLAGWSLYDRYCLPCHGVAGDGRGPAAPYSAGRPRDFTKGEFAWRTTPLGSAPTRDDLRLTIRHGAPNTSMHAFPLGDAEIDQLIEVVLSFAPPAQAGKPIALAPPPARDAERGKLLWTEKGCSTCHGVTGDSVVAAAIIDKPYALTREPLRRPRADGDIRRAAALAIATGRGPMPGYAGALPDKDIWALADHVISLQASARARGAVMDVRAIDLDRTAKIATGTWPGTGDEAVVFGGPIAPQGPPPPNLAPVQASISAPQCARCHAKQYREWQGSRHRGAVTPGLRAQMMGMKPDAALACLRCHAPLAEQRTHDSTPLREQAVSCAGCHVRGWKRHGPERVASSLLPISGYPLVKLDLYERSDFCMPCHQLPPRTSVVGRPLLDTYREWLEGPYMARGIQCQHCHMPNREHTFKGIHDPHTFRQGISLTGRAHVKDGAITVVAELGNVGAGHFLPTTPTPAVWIVIELLDGNGKLIPGATSEMRIGRDISFDAGKWTEHSDTRIPPGERAVMSRAWKGGRTAQAVTARILLVVHPDDYYERLYERRLAGKLIPERRALYQQALATAKAARYHPLARNVPITR